MKRAAVKSMNFFKCYHSLILWGICAGFVLMTFFNIYIPGVLWLIALFIGLFFEWRAAFRWRNECQVSKKLKIFVIIAMIFSFSFTVLNFFFHLSETGGSQPEIVDGVYTLVNYDGKGTKIITEQEYYHFKCVEQRFFAGHLLSFYAVCMTSYLGKKKNN